MEGLIFMPSDAPVGATRLLVGSVLCLGGIGAAMFKLTLGKGADRWRVAGALFGLAMAGLALIMGVRWWAALIFGLLVALPMALVFRMNVAVFGRMQEAPPGFMRTKAYGWALLAFGVLLFGTSIWALVTSRPTLLGAPPYALLVVSIGGVFGGVWTVREVDGKND